MAIHDTHSPLPPSQADLSSELVQAEEVVMDCLNMLAASVHLDTAIDSFLETLGCFYDAGHVFLFQTHEEFGTVSCSFTWPTSFEPPVRTASIYDFSEWIAAFESDGFLRLSCADDPRLAPLIPVCTCQPTSVLAVPLYTDLDLSGFLCVVEPKQHSTNLKVALAVASLSVVELHKQHLLAQLDYLHHNDPLTGTYNRFSYVSSLSKSYQPTPASMGVIIVSVNGLKAINAALGLTFGDSIIQQVAEIMKATLCANIYRSSSDEFVSLHPNCSTAEFHELVDGLHAAFDSSEICNVSVGTAWADCEVDIYDLLLQADQQLTENKKAASPAAFF